MFPLRVSDDGRHLRNQSGRPVFINGEAAWSLVAQLTLEQAEHYLTDRMVRGFNAVLVTLVEHRYADSAPANIYGQSPWRDLPFISCNEEYFRHADSVVRLAGSLGFSVFVFPLYIGYNCGDQGWCAEMRDAGPAAMRRWGTFVGDRYKSFPNIVWVIGGDADPAPVRDEIDAFVDALRSADTLYPNRIISAHGRSGTDTFAQFPESWLTLNGIYTWDISEIVPLARTAHARRPSIPFMLLEANYENKSGFTAHQLRAQAYSAMMNGACGQFFGNSPIWYFSTAVVKEEKLLRHWTSYLGSEGSRSMTYLANLFTSLDWWKLIPDTGKVILHTTTPSDVSAPSFAYSTDSTTIVGYLPLARTVMVDPRILHGDTVDAWWFNPSNGVYNYIGRTLKTIRAFTPQRSGDWIIVLKSGESADAVMCLEE